MTILQKHAAHNLKGEILKGDWLVVAKKGKPTHSGGAFSVGYTAEKEGKQCFVKAMDYATIFQMPDGTRMAEQCLAAYNYEVDLLQNCRDTRMKRVIRILDNGQIRKEGFEYPDVSYILLENADGDIRNADPHMVWDNALSMRALHRIAGGIRELHRELISHRDIKPSNILVLDQSDFANSVKIGDLGNAEISDKPNPLVGNAEGGGDPVYQPPEILYQQSNHSAGKFDVDFYLLGSMVLFLLMGQGTTPLLLSQLPYSQSPQQWRGNFEEILPMLQMAFFNILENLNEKIRQDMLTLRGKPATDLISVVTELCHPNPENRGDKGHIKKFDAGRYETTFDRLAKSFERRFSQ